MADRILFVERRFGRGRRSGTLDRYYIDAEIAKYVVVRATDRCFATRAAGVNE